MIYTSSIQLEELEEQLRIAEEKQKKKDKIQNIGFLFLCIFSCLCCNIQTKVIGIICIVSLVLGFIFLIEFGKEEDKRVENLINLLNLKNLETKVLTNQYVIEDTNVIIDNEKYDGTNVICKDGLDFRYLDERKKVEVEHINFTVKKNHVKANLNLSFFILFFGLIYIGVFMYSHLSDILIMTVGVALLLVAVLGSSYFFFYLATKDVDLYKRVCFEEYDNFCKLHKDVYVSNGNICSFDGKQIKVEKEFLTEIKQNEGKLDFRL